MPTIPLYLHEHYKKHVSWKRQTKLAGVHSELWKFLIDENIKSALSSSKHLFSRTHAIAQIQ